MTAGEVTERLGRTRSELEQACTWLANPSPAVLDRCTGVLAAAASELTSPAGWLSLARGDPDALAEAWKLQRAVRRAGKLLDHASEYHIQRTRALGGRMEEYRPGGVAALPFHAPTIILQG